MPGDIIGTQFGNCSPEGLFDNKGEGMVSVSSSGKGGNLDDIRVVKGTDTNIYVHVQVRYGEVSRGGREYRAEEVNFLKKN